MKRLFAFIMTLCLLILCGCSQTVKSADESVSTDATPINGHAPVISTSDLAILYEQDDDMINNYSLLAVNPDAPFTDADGNTVSDVGINTEGASALINWLLSADTEAMAASYGYADYGDYLFFLKDGAPVSVAEISPATEETKVIRLSTTTSVNDSGLLDYLLPAFESAYGYTVEVFSAGTGKSIANAKAGNADLIWVHSKAQEEAFIADGFSYVLDGLPSERLTFLYNYFVLCGPSEDPVQVSSKKTVKDAFATIAEAGHTFISRGDSSGTHTKEISLWPESLGITVEADSVKDLSWYVYSNAGMGTCLTMAEEMNGYILSDKATFMAFQKNQLR